MIKFLFKGILRDKGRSLLPLIVISLGVMVTVLMHCWLEGIMGESIQMNVNFLNGHVKLMTRAYSKNINQMPNELALLNVQHLIDKLKKENKEMDWVQRIRFGALLDFPDSVGETQAQGPVVGWAIDLLSADTKETDRFNIRKSIKEGKLPAVANEVLISNTLADKLKITPGNTVTLFGTTMDGGMAFKNFVVSGTISFGSSAIDKGAIIMDITGAQEALQMTDAASEILGFFNNNQYNNEKAEKVAASFNSEYLKSNDEFAPVMFTFREQEGMADLLNISKIMGNILIVVFLMAMSVVLWNTGLIGSLRRFNEFGVRLAMGEDKNHIYKSLIYEGILIGIIGTIIGTIIGVSISYFIQIHGLDISGMMKNSSLLMPSVARTIVTPQAFFIGFIPGLFSMVLGSALAGIRIYKRETARLFKELEV